MQVLPYLEHATPAIYHAPTFFLNRIDAVQDDFLADLGLSARNALLIFHLARLTSRRDIAMLAVIHRCVLGRGPSQFVSFFQPMRTAHFPRNLREDSLRHNRQLQDPIDGASTNAVRRSAVGLIYVYNSLPQRTVDKQSVPSFQRALQKGLRQACDQELDGWPRVLHEGPYQLALQRFQQLF